MILHTFLRDINEFSLIDGVAEAIKKINASGYLAIVVTNASSVFYIAPLVVSGYFAFLYNLPAQIEYYYEKTNYIAGGTCAAAVLNIIMNYFGIKYFGSIAAAYTTLIIYLIYFLIHYFLAVKIHGRQIFDLMKLIVYSGALIIVAALSLFLRGQIVVRWGAVLILCVLGILWADKEFKVFSVLKKRAK